jgi:peptidoglycan/LPS O-acetylase OafA/YrhL
MIRSTSAFADSKQHFLILDALRGIAAVMVVLMHGFEIFCGGNYHEMIINHGYLAVDFFFMLSGYVMAHAYDDRWDRMTVGYFFKRRLIRLHPLIIVGTILGALLFYFQESAVFPKISGTPLWQLILVMLVGLTLIPLPPSMDIRGWNEMHPLNGPSWSLFLEYVANLLHALVLRKLSKPMLSVLVILAGIALVHLATQGRSGDLIGGWSLEPLQLRYGFTRLLFPYMAGMLLRRAVRVRSNQNTFILAAIILIAALSIPRIGGNERLWLNGLYESFVIILVFPLVIYLGAIGTVKGAIANRICVFMGDISYPLYITHFPLMCLFYAWVVNNKIPLSTGIWAIILLTLVSMGLAYLWLKLYDEPVRKWLTRRFM